MAHRAKNHMYTIFERGKKRSKTIINFAFFKKGSVVEIPMYVLFPACELNSLAANHVVNREQSRRTVFLHD
jgi:hypothetical protein